eukprot:1927256-Prymnesium_polylepis.2
MAWRALKPILTHERTEEELKHVPTHERTEKELERAHQAYIQSKTVNGRFCPTPELGCNGYDSDDTPSGSAEPRRRRRRRCRATSPVGAPDGPSM